MVKDLDGREPASLVACTDIKPHGTRLSLGWRVDWPTFDRIASYLGWQRFPACPPLPAGSFNSCLIRLRSPGEDYSETEFRFVRPEVVASRSENADRDVGVHHCAHIGG